MTTGLVDSLRMDQLSNIHYKYYKYYKYLYIFELTIGYEATFANNLTRKDYDIDSTASVQ